MKKNKLKYTVHSFGNVVLHCYINIAKINVKPSTFFKSKMLEYFSDIITEKMSSTRIVGNLKRSYGEFNLITITETEINFLENE